MSEENFERFKKCTVEILSVDIEKITPEASFENDLEADSLDVVELIMALEEEFGIEIPEEELEGIETIGAAFDLITSRLN